MNNLDIRQQEFRCLDRLDIAVLLQLRNCTDAEKERLLKHLELENTLKSVIDN